MLLSHLSIAAGQYCMANHPPDRKDSAKPHSKWRMNICLIYSFYKCIQLISTCSVVLVQYWVEVFWVKATLPKAWQSFTNERCLILSYQCLARTIPMWLSGNLSDCQFKTCQSIHDNRKSSQGLQLSGLARKRLVKVVKFNSIVYTRYLSKGRELSGLARKRICQSYKV